MTKVVISQPMLFPWVGILEQVTLADVYVFYPDVQFSKGGYVNRVQVKTPTGVRWLTIPLQKMKLTQRINEVCISDLKDWRSSHLSLISSAYRGSHHFGDALRLMQGVYSNSYDNLAELSEASTNALCDYFGLIQDRRFLLSSTLGIEGSGSRRVLDIVHAVGGSTYITGHGARNYLDHELFEAEGVGVEYMDYRLNAYSQLHGPFTPYVSALDLVANLGLKGRQMICSGSISWREFVNRDRF